MSRLSEIHLQA